MLGYLRLEVLRTLRNRQYLLMIVVLPAVFAVFFTKLFGSFGTAEEARRYAASYMVSMMAFGGMGAVLTATGPRIATERDNGWLRQLRATPLSARAVFAAKVLAATALALPSLVLVAVVGWAVNGVNLSWWQWPAILALLWLGTVPFAGLGVLLGYLLNPDASAGATSGVYLMLALLGGLWVPVQLFPATLVSVVQWLPSYRYADLGRAVLAGHGPGGVSMAVLVGYGLVFAAAATARYRRTALVR